MNLTQLACLKARRHRSYVPGSAGDYLVGSLRLSIAGTTRHARLRFHDRRLRATGTSRRKSALGPCWASDRGQCAPASHRTASPHDVEPRARSPFSARRSTERFPRLSRAARAWPAACQSRGSSAQDQRHRRRGRHGIGCARILRLRTRGGAHHSRSCWRSGRRQNRLGHDADRRPLGAALRLLPADDRSLSQQRRRLCGGEGESWHHAERDRRSCADDGLRAERLRRHIRRGRRPDLRLARPSSAYACALPCHSGAADAHQPARDEGRRAALGGAHLSLHRQFHGAARDGRIAGACRRGGSPTRRAAAASAAGH